MKRLVLPVALVFVLSLFGATPARAATPHNDTVSGLEIFPGVVVGDVRFGATFVGRATGDLPGFIAASINYTPPNPGPGVTNTVVGGRWTLSVYQGGEFRGTGAIAGGAAAWNATGTLASVNLVLAVVSGTGAYSGATGTGSFAGLLSHLTFPPRWGGALTLNF